ncbi:MAG: hypothetical protein ACRBBV_02810 [Paracoccaceae bacterium]
MKRAVFAVMVTGALSACGGDGTNPFDDPVEVTEPTTGETEEVSTLDPNVREDSRFLFDPENKLTMNAVSYDATANELVINNLPFDGPDQRYTAYGSRNGADFYASQKTQTTGQIQHYAVYVASGDMQAFAAAGAEWNDFGFGGANVRRNDFALPGGVGEYVYLGTYAGVRTYSDRGGLDLVTGDTRLLLDILDFDPDGGVQGAITGRVTNRVRTRPGGPAVLANLPTLYLQTVTFNSDDGTFEGGIATTYDFDGVVREDGTYDGMIGGAAGENLGVASVIEGTAEMQQVTYDVVTWTNTEVVAVTDPVTGITYNTSVTTTGVESGLEQFGSDNLQTLVESGQPVGHLSANTGGIPAGASTETETETITITSDFDARELGVIVTDQVVPTP